MSTNWVQQPHWSSVPVLFTLLPGPDRRRADSTYRYRLTYRNGAETEAGCVMAWEVSGGRQSYQIAVERDEQGELRLHCTCADAVYRAEEEGRHCKHVAGLLAFAAPAYQLVEVRAQPAALRIWPAFAAGATAPVRLSSRKSGLGEVA